MRCRVPLVSLIAIAALATLSTGQDIPPASSAELADTGVPGQSVLLVRFAEPPRFQTVTIYPYDRAAVLRDDANYLNALQAITLQVTESNLAPTRPNGSALGQLRTNEFLDSPWELREFKLPTGNGNLTPSTVAMTPDPSFENGAPEAALGAWLDTRPPGPVIPLTVSGIGPMLGGNAAAPGPNWHWNPPTSTFERRFKFSLNTCNACHAGETQTWFGNPGFRHVVEEFFGTPAGLSAFLVGDPANAADNFWHDVNDPVNGVEHLFFDLEVRRLHLDALIASSCLSGVVFQALASPH